MLEVVDIRFSVDKALKSFHRGLTQTETYCSRPRIRDLARVLGPLVIMTVFMGKRSVEHIADVGHRVHADRGALEHRTGRQRQLRSKFGRGTSRERIDPLWLVRATHPAVVKTA